MAKGLYLHRKGRVIVYAAVFVLALALDLLTKKLALEYLVPGKPVEFIPGVMELVLVRNTGAAFSMGEGAQWLFVLIALVVMGWITYTVVTTDRLYTRLVVCAGLVSAGAAGNCIDRVTQGWVCDFFNPTFIDFAVFNVADIFVTLGIAFGILFYFQWDAARQKEQG
jgi:signal peptidase II